MRRRYSVELECLTLIYRAALADSHDRLRRDDETGYMAVHLAAEYLYRQIVNYP